MKHEFVADGFLRLSRGKKAVIAESIGKKYAAELTQASPAEQPRIRERMADELLRREKMAGHKPSPATLW